MKSIVMAGALLVGISLTATAGENWPQWRGPHLNGTAEGHNLPAKWSETENIVWKIALPVWSGSTPAIWEDRIFLTSPEESPPTEPAVAAEAGGRRARYRDPGGQDIYLLCLSRADGGEIWRKKIGSGNRFQMKQNMSSPSPVTDGKNLWTLTGNGDLKCFDLDGNEVWNLNLQEKFGAFGLNHGFANSPLLYTDRLIIPVLHGMKTDDPSYLVAINKSNGETIWRTERPTDAIAESPDAYTTPQIWIPQQGNPQIVINGADIVTGNDFVTGQELWRVLGMNPQGSRTNRTIASCAIAGEIVFAPGNRGNLLMAIKPGGKGDVTATHVLWQSKWSSDVPTPVSDGKYVWISNDRGIFACLDAKTGEPLYEPQRIAQGTYSSSPVLADGKVYCMNETAAVTVLEAGPEFKVLGTNEVEGGYTLSSPVIIGDRIYLRTSENLYCIGKTAEGD